MDHAIARLVDATVSSRSRSEFHAEALSVVRGLVGFDSAAVVLPGTRPVTVDKGPRTTDTFVANRARYARELLPVARAAIANGGVALDTAVLSGRERDRLTMYHEVIRPQGIRSTVFSYLQLAGFTSAVISFARHESRAFEDQDLSVLRRLVPALALGDEHFRRGPPTRETGGPDWSILTPRESNIVDFVCLGLTNAQIALACSLSPNTVRNHLARIFAKLEVSNRVELVRLATSTKPHASRGSSR